jgi:DNA-directed RNA polymerase specialized sigma24 family protein
MDATGQVRVLDDADEQLAISIERGDVGALDALYERLGTAAYTVACGIAGDAVAAEVVERAFARIRTEIADYDGQTSLATWCWRIVRAEARARRSPAARVSTPPALLGRPPMERRCIELVVLQGMTLGEAAAALGIGRMAAARHVHVGLRSLAAAG